MFSIAVINFQNQGTTALLANAALGVLAIPLVIVVGMYIYYLIRFDEIA